MPSKTEEYLALAQRTANGLTRYWEHWTDYLTTASRLYKYSFADQLMIYAQRPDATACASFDIWNNRMNRYVRRGSKGIALLDQSSSVPRLHYVFDVSDTGGRRNLTPEQKKYLIGKQYEAEKCSNGGDRKSAVAKSGCQIGNLIPTSKTCQKVAKENGVGMRTVFRAEEFAKGVDAAEEAVPGTRQKVLSGEVKPTAAEIASVARAPPEERPALVAEICKPKDQKKAAAVETTSSPAAKPLSDSSTSEEECTDEELVHTPAPQEQTFPQRVNESLKIDRQQILEIANSRYVPKRLADGTAMLCEVSGAANSMMRRWESVFREYPDILSDAENRASVERTIQKLRDYLKNLEDKMEELL